MDFVRKFVALDAHRLVLTRKEYELLALLVENAGEIIPRPILLMRVWGYSNEIRTRTLDVHVRRLRKKLGQYSEQYIETIFGIGYRFQPFRLTQRFPSGVSAAPIAVGALPFRGAKARQKRILRGVPRLSTLALVCSTPLEWGVPHARADSTCEPCFGRDLFAR
jgi:hypothetical protein